MAAISGFGGRVIIGTGTTCTLPVGRWTVNWRLENVDVSTFEHGIMKEYMGTAYDVEITLDAFWDQGVDTFNSGAANTPNLLPGGLGITQLATTSVYVQLHFCKADTTLRVFKFPQVLIESVSVDDEVRGVVRYSVVGRASRKVTFSSGVATQDANTTFVPNNTAQQNPTIP